MSNIVVKKRSGEVAIGLVLFLLGAWWAWQSYQIGLHVSGEIGPGAFPFGIGLLLAGSGLGCAFRAAGSTQSVEIEKAALALFAVTVAFGVLFVLLSPILASTLFLAVMLSISGKQSARKAWPIALVISLILFVVFDMVLGVQLPADQLVEWLKS